MEITEKKRHYYLNVGWLFILLCLGTANVLGQINTTGVVTDAKQVPMIGVNIIVKGTHIGTITDTNGKYSIKTPNTSSILSYSYLGFQTVEKKVTGSVMNITMEEAKNQMDELVVVAYGTQKKSSLTGSVSTVQTTSLSDQPYARADQALQGMVAGLQINNTDPTAGASPEIRVRGMGSINATSDPLIVVDGLPLPEGDGLSNIDMGDVQSIEVLKDAASASLYGSRAANGVILVTTKTGSSGKTKINFKMYEGISTAYKMPDILNWNQYVGLLYHEASLRQQDPSVDGTTNTMAFNKITTAEQAAYLIQNYYDDGPTNWLNEAMNNHGTIQSYDLSASGGTGNLKYFVSGNYNGQVGIMQMSKYDKFSIRANLTANLTKNIRLGVNITPTYSGTKTPASNLIDYERFPSWLPVRYNAATAALTGKTVGTYAQPSDFNGTTVSGIGYDGSTWNDVGVNPFSSSNQTPVSVSDRTGNYTDKYNIQNNVYLNITLLPGLQFKTTGTAYFNYLEQNIKQQTSAAKAGNPNELTRRMILTTELLTENTLNYSKKLGNNSFQGLLGYTYQKNSSRSNTMVGTGFPDENVLSFNMASQLLLNSPSLPGTTSYYYTDALMSFIGRINYDYLGKYLASVSMRSDGSSKFAAGHKWGYFPAVSDGWRVSEEKFLKKADWLSNLKLRASYGITGNNNIPQYSDMNVINSSNYDLGAGNGTLVPGMASNGASLGNPQITWEQTEEADYGLDFGAFNSRLNLTVDYYNSNTKQLLLQQAAMYITGHQSYWNNIGKVNNKGLEIEISSTNIVTKNFTWKTSINFSTNKNTLLSLGGPTSLYTYGERNEVYAAIVGQPAIQFYGYKTDGVYTTFAQVAAAKALNVNGTPFLYTKYAPVVGGVKVLNTNGDNTLDANDRVVLGSPFPQFTWGITNTFTYKKFDLSFLIQGVQGNKVLDGNVYYNEELRSNEAYLKNRYISPMFPGDGKTVYSNTTPGADLMLTDYGLENGSFAALRNLTLAYTLSSNLVRKFGISNLRIYLSGQNLAYLMAPGYRGINPESRMTSSYYSSPLISGYQRGDFPISKIYSIGFDLSL